MQYNHWACDRDINLQREVPYMNSWGIWLAPFIFKKVATRKSCSRTQNSPNSSLMIVPWDSHLRPSSGLHPIGRSIIPTAGSLEHPIRTRLLRLHGIHGTFEIASTESSFPLPSRADSMSPCFVQLSMYITATGIGKSARGVLSTRTWSKGIGKYEYSDIRCVGNTIPNQV